MADGSQVSREYGKQTTHWARLRSRTCPCSSQISSVLNHSADVRDAAVGTRYLTWTSEFSGPRAMMGRWVAPDSDPLYSLRLRAFKLQNYLQLMRSVPQATKGRVVSPHTLSSWACYWHPLKGLWYLVFLLFITASLRFPSPRVCPGQLEASSLLDDPPSQHPSQLGGSSILNNRLTLNMVLATALKVI